ncbi:c-type cytochrome biogenesis protein CcmI [Thalassotalea profundi]|uniref:C-type cytochrome biogenesis protein CcmI n=1 Tax=Thalassotalea profundi TaxID=2036687 RepID=A0ABQ3IZ17_9GAMM|nr:c-type cytochrome biogenesis protein CcmI [Thalassotalea profundi]GHE95241.1 c-type cytochrome biogenesis protein CcmI [Thalassotalea profundi]
MPEFFIITLIFIALTLVVVWLHFLKQGQQQNVVDNSLRDETNIRLYHEHKAEIEKDLEKGNIDQESYSYLITELDQSLLQDIEENQAETKKSAAQAKRLSILWPVMLSLFIIVFSGYYYHQHGAYQLVSSTPKSNADSEQINAEQAAFAELQKVKAELDKNPDNSDLWYSYGQGLVGTRQFEQAQSAFDKVIELEGEKADVYGAKAQASYYQNQQQITAQVQAFIDKALSIDPNEPSTNILLGMDHFLAERFEEAIRFWQLVVDDNRTNVNIAALQQAINEAKNRLMLSQNPNSESVSNDVKLDIVVSLSDDIIEKLSKGEDKIVFIYAIPTDGARMPLAAVKVKASDLPLEISLTDANAMTPQAKLSDVTSVHLFAIVSADGGVGIKSGDFKAEINNVDLSNDKTHQLVIDQVVE